MGFQEEEATNACTQPALIKKKKILSIGLKKDMWGRVVNKKKEQWNDKKETKKISVSVILTVLPCMNNNA